MITALNTVVIFCSAHGTNLYRTKPQADLHHGAFRTFHTDLFHQKGAL